MLTIQKGVRVTSTSREGSQNPTGTPGTRGRGGLGHNREIDADLSIFSPASIDVDRTNRNGKQA